MWALTVLIESAHALKRFSGQAKGVEFILSDPSWVSSRTLSPSSAWSEERMVPTQRQRGSGLLSERTLTSLLWFLSFHDTCWLKNKIAQCESCEFSFIWGQNEDCSPRDSASESSEKLQQEVQGQGSQVLQQKAGSLNITRFLLIKGKPDISTWRI